MSKIISAVVLSAAFNARYPSAVPGVIDSITAAGDTSVGKIKTVQAAAVKSYSAVSGSTQWVKAIDHFYVAGELITIGDFVEVQELDALRLERGGKAELSSAEAAASARGKA